MRPNVVVVYPGPWWGWEVVLDGHAEPVSFEDREPAIEYARAMASAMRPSRVRVEDMLGHLDVEWDWALEEQLRT